MKRATIIIGVAAALLLALAITGRFTNLDDVILSWAAPRMRAPSAKSDAERRVLEVLNEMRANGGTYLSVSEEKGRVLRVLTEAAGARHVVEIGTSTGYSGLWFCLALQTTGGHLTTFEIDPGRAARARSNFKSAGVDKLARVIEGDAHDKLAEVNEPVDVAFIDAEKNGYPNYLKQLLPRVRLGGLILADNLNMSPEYRETVTTDPALETVVWGYDLGITLKKR
ncbi:MAG: O-methyltransferase [Deltaproteobacteria bacterium]